MRGASFALLCMSGIVLLTQTTTTTAFVNHGVIPTHTDSSTTWFTKSEKRIVSSNHFSSVSTRSGSSRSVSRLMASQEDKEEKARVKSKLLTESIAPWRTLRLFLYGSLGSGAFLGGFISLTGLLAAISNNKPDIDFQTEYLNLGIDFGAVIVFIALFYYDSKKGDELNSKVTEKIQQTKENKVVRKAMKEREQVLGELELNVRISQEEMSRVVVKDIQSGAKQHMIIVAGTRKPIRDALLGANLLKMEFAMRDVLVVPMDISKSKSKKMSTNDAMIGTSTMVEKGFGKNKPTWESAAYVAQPIGDEWDEYINAEINDAIVQNGKDVVDEGIAIVVANTGEIIRRGVGQVPWRDMVEELEKKVKEDEQLDLSFLTGS